MAPPAAESCCCLRCGYSLTGLALPRPCPECGHPAEVGYEERARPVREWFSSWRAWGWCLRRSARVPAGLFYVLHDAAFRRTAWRRLLLVLCLPAILSSLIALGGNSVCVNYSVRIWWHNVHDPQRRALREETETQTDRLYGFNLHLPLFRGGLFFKRPSYWVEVEERKRTGLSLAKPDLDDPALIAWAVAPWALLLCGFVPGRILVWFLARRRTVRTRYPAAPRASASALSLMAIPLGWSLWAWMLFAVLGGLDDLINLPRHLLSVTFVVVGAAWVTGCILGWVQIARLDASRFIFPWPLRLGFLLGGMGAVPVLWVALYSLY
jgi:hypothetical protein